MKTLLYLMTYFTIHNVIYTSTYKLESFILKNREINHQLLYHCIKAIPVQIDLILDSKSPKLTVKQMEHDGYLILKKCN